MSASALARLTVATASPSCLRRNSMTSPRITREAPPGASPALEPPLTEAPSGRAWKHRHVLDLDDFCVDEIEPVLDTTEAMKEVLARDVPRTPALRGTTIVTLFYEAST